MSTLRNILYNQQQADGTVETTNDYQSVLTQTQQHISNQYADILSQTILESQSRETVRYLIEKYVTENNLHIDDMDVSQLTMRLYQDMAGYGILERYLADPEIEEINGNGWFDIEVVDENGWRKIPERFNNAGQAVDIIKRMTRISGHVLDWSTPWVDAYTTAGVRITAYIPPIVEPHMGVSFSIRKQRTTNLTKNDLIKAGTATEEMLDFLMLCLNHGVSLAIAGRTGSGKTTDLSFLLNNVNVDLRILTIEETREILIVNPTKDDGTMEKRINSLCTRPSDDPRLHIDQTHLLRGALRMSPNIIVMAEMRGAEAMEAQEAARTDHTVASTLHANSARQAYSRMLTMCQMKDTTLPTFLIMSLLVEAYPIMVYVKQMPNGKRTFIEIIEAYGSLDATVKANTLYRLELNNDGTWTHVRERGISASLAERFLLNGADPKTVAFYQDTSAKPERRPTTKKTARPSKEGDTT